MNPDILQWVTIIVLALGLILSYLKNAQAQNEKHIELTTIVRGIKDDLDSEINGLNAINSKIGGMKENCARVSSALTQRVIGHDREIAELKRGPPR